MPKRLSILVALLGTAVLLLGALPISQASADSPWWQVLTGSRPTNMWEPSDNEQEIETALGEKFNQKGLAVAIEVEGKTIGCLGTKNAIGTSTCKGLTGFAAPIETAAELQTLLQGTYGTSTVEVTGGPVAVAPLHILVPDRGAPQVQPDALLGTAKAKLLAEGGSGRLVSTITNLGNAAVDATVTPVTITDELPAGAIATGVDAYGGFQGKAAPVDCSVEAPDEVVCLFEGVLPSYEAIEIEVFATLTGEPPAAGAPGLVSVSGGNAPSASASQELKASPEPVPFGIERFYAQGEAPGGAPAPQAGSHPEQLVTTLQVNSGAFRLAPSREGATIEQPALPRNVRAPLPAGLTGNATAMARCDMATFLTVVELINKCPDAAAIGVASVTVIETASLGFARIPVPVFNLPPGHGEPARFGFVVAGVPVIISTALDDEDEYRIVASVSNITQLAQYLASTISLWGTPGDPSHDDARGWNCVYRVINPEAPPCQRPPDLPETAFLRMPVQCASPLEYGLSLEPWNVPLGSVVDSASSTSEPLGGCNRIPFDPGVDAAPTAKLAESPSGLDFKLTMPNSGLLNGEGIAEGQPKKVEVTLPEGVTLNPSAAEGLAVCTPADYARERFDSRPGEGCPEASKIGSVQIESPLVEGDIDGALYLAAPHDNPFDSLLALYIVAKLPERGVLVKLAGKVEPDEQTGRIVTTFDDAPQQPFESFELHFREGGRAPLVTPPACGDYDIVARFTPWSAQDPSNPAPSEIVTTTSTFTVQRGVDGGACPGGGIPSFGPGFEAGSINNDAGAHTPFNMRLIRRDGEQDMTKFSTVLPPGVLGKLSGVAKCPDAAIAIAKQKSASEEIASPSCPAGSQIGRSIAGAGVGSVLTWVPGKLYLGGPYNGDPLSVISVTPAKAGPFDVGTVVVRVALTLNPRTAEVQVDGSASDPIPHILEGIPLKLRDLRVYVDRPDFIINPTSCDEEQARATLFGSFLNVLDPADDKPVDLATRYQAANCQNLGLKPRLNLNLKGGTKRGGHPGLTATYTPRPGDANIEDLVVRLPKSAFLDQAHIRTICTRVQFAADACPKGAQYGFIRAWTPLLDEPLAGPAYLRSSNNKLPDLVFDLKGIVDVEVATRLDSVRGGIRASVEDAPDAPISKVVLKMQGQKKGLIINSRDLCAAPSKAGVQFTGQNGKQLTVKPVMRAQCGGKGRRGKRK